MTFKRILHNLSERPELLQLLCEPIRNRKVLVPRQELVDEFRVSVTYDNSGNIVDRYIGWGVGHLAGNEQTL